MVTRLVLASWGMLALMIWWVAVLRSSGGDGHRVRWNRKWITWLYRLCMDILGCLQYSNNIRTSSIYIYTYTMDIYRGYGVFTETCWKSTLSTWSGVDSGFWGSEVFTGACTRRSVSVVCIYKCHIDHRSSLLLPSFDIITCNIVISYHIVSYHILILCSIICHMSCCNIVSYTVILYHNIRWYCHIVILYTYIVIFKYDILSYVSYRIIYMRLIVVAILKCQTVLNTCTWFPPQSQQHQNLGLVLLVWMLEFSIPI